MRLPRLASIGSCFLFLTACSGDPQAPVLGFVGVASGSVATPTEALSFADRFPAGLRSVVGIAAFERVAEGTQVTASWFTPDDRSPPFARRTLTVESGAVVGRFALSSNGPWQPGPYLLQIHANVPLDEGEAPLTASGSARFFVGMSAEEIAAYREDYKTWQEAQTLRRLQNETETADTEPAF